MADQIIDIGNNKRIVYRDGKSYLQIMAGGRVVSETQVTSSQAQQELERSSAEERSKTTSVERLTIEQLDGIIKDIESIKANAQGRYVYRGTTYTKTGLNNLLKPYKDRLKELREISAESALEREVADQQQIAQNEAEVNRVNRILVDISTRIEDLRSAADRAETTRAQDNLRSWVAYYTSQANRLQTYVNGLKAGTARVGDAQTDITLVEVSQAETRPPSGGAAPQPGVVYGGVPGAGQGMASTTQPATSPGMVSTGLTAGQRGEQGIMPGTAAETVVPADETPIEVDETPERITPPDIVTDTTPGDVPSPTAPQPGQSYTEPATGITYRPGDQIGGEDRTLPNGGAVVNGTYIPPGIDYAALGQAMQDQGMTVPEEWEKAAREMFGVWYDVFKDDPEMSAFIQRLMREPEMSDEMFMAELQKTNWWKTTNATARDFARRQIEDPATLNTQIANQTASLRQEALARGLTTDDASLNDAALKIIQFGFSTQTALNHLAQLTLGTAQGPSSLVRGFYGQTIRETAASFGVPLSDSTLTKWASDIATGNQSVSSFEAYARDLAKNLYPSLSNGFDRGLSFAQMTNPYAQVASRILDIPGDSVDFTDPKWAAAFTMRNDKGEQTQMSYGEWADYLRTNKSFGYEYTDEAVSKAYNVVNSLAEAFGRA